MSICAKELDRKSKLYNSHTGFWTALCWLVSGLAYRDAVAKQELPGSGCTASTAPFALGLPCVLLKPGMKPWRLPGEQAQRRPGSQNPAVVTHCSPADCWLTLIYSCALLSVIWAFLS